MNHRSIKRQIFSSRVEQDLSEIEEGSQPSRLFSRILKEYSSREPALLKKMEEANTQWLAWACEEILGPFSIAVLAKAWDPAELLLGRKTHLLLRGWIDNDPEEKMPIWPIDHNARFLWHQKSGLWAATTLEEVRPVRFMTFRNGVDTTLKAFPWDFANFSI